MPTGRYERKEGHGNTGVSLKRSTIRKVFERYAVKGPVNYPGPQRSANEAYEDIKHLFTQDERNKLSTARSHAVGPGGTEGRGEFDSVCAAIRKRLFGE